MTDVFVVEDNIVSPLGFTTACNYGQLTSSMSGIKLHTNKQMSAEPFNASLFDDEFSLTQANNTYTKFEKLLIASIQNALAETDIDIKGRKTVLIISSTKGNISLLETGQSHSQLKKRISLYASARLVAEHFNFLNQPIVVSNACISGLLAVITGMRLLKSGLYENAVIAGADVISKFVLSGFQAFQAVSAEPCKPFDKNRTGISLGEGAATVILSTNKKYNNGLKVISGATGNDANHISGPSRTGEELCYIIKKVIKDAGLKANDINFISAHGTATIYNDEMEAKAIGLAELAHVPVNSLKGYYGHTLGAAGLIESVITIKSMKESTVLATKGFEQSGVSVPLNLSNVSSHTSLQNCLKIASGFGGCNAAVIFSKL